MDLGGFAWDIDRKRKAGTTITLAVCLPRIEFAAVLLGAGAILRTAEQMSRSEEMQVRLLSMVGQNVIITAGHRTLAGRLDEVPEDLDGYVKITVQQRAGHVPDRKCPLRELLMLRNIEAVQVSGRPINLERAQSDRQLQRLGETHAIHATLAEVFGAPLADWITGENSIVAAVIGEKHRINWESRQSIARTPKDMDVHLSDILRPHEDSNFTNNAHITLQSNRTFDGGKFPSLVILEADRRLPDLLESLAHKTRIVLLGRSTPTYEMAADTVLRAHAARIHDAEPCPMPPPIETLSFTS
jgi:hypothetical protein